MYQALPDAPIPMFSRQRARIDSYKLPTELHRDRETSAVRLFTRVHVTGVHEISTVDQAFKCRLWICFNWFVDRKIGELKGDEWHPIAKFPNMVLDASSVEVTLRTFPTDVHDRTEMQCEYEVEADFKEYFELEHFPFDSQSLKIHCSLANCPHSVELVRVKEAVEIVPTEALFYPEGFIPQNAWFNECAMDVTTAVTRHDRHLFRLGFNEFIVELHLKRKTWFYVWDIILPVSSMSVLSMISFFMDGLSDKMQLTTTLLLTIMATKIAVGEHIPATSYLTILERIIISNMFFILLVIAQNVAVSVFPGRPDYEVASQVALATTWVLGHVFCVARVYMLRPPRP
jgi:hypothetical protein